MANSATNRGKYNLLSHRYRGATLPSAMYVALCTAATTPTPDTNVLGDLTEIAAGNGYTSGGYSLTPGATDFDTLVEDDTNDWAYVQAKDVVWTASGGNLPASGSGASWAVLLGPHATVGSREVDAAYDLTSARTVSVGQTLTLQNLEIRLT